MVGATSKCKTCEQRVPVTAGERGMMVYEGHKKLDGSLCPRSFKWAAQYTNAKGSTRTYDRARLHRALDAVMDATPDGNFSPDEDDRMKALVAEAQKVVRKWKADREKLCVKCYEIGGNFRGTGYWKRIREIIKVGLE